MPIGVARCSRPEFTPREYSPFSSDHVNRWSGSPVPNNLSVDSGWQNAASSNRKDGDRKRLSEWSTGKNVSPSKVRNLRPFRSVLETIGLLLGSDCEMAKSPSLRSLIEATEVPLVVTVDDSAASNHVESDEQADAAHALSVAE